MLERFRQFWTNVFRPVADLLLRMGVSPDAVTLVGTIGVSFGALFFFPRGWLLAGVLFISAFIFSDLIDGSMARSSGRASAFGAFFDSTLDRFGDGAIFGGLLLYYAGPGDSEVYVAVSLYCLVMGSVTSYARARAESLGMSAKGGIAERSDRLVAILLMTGLTGLLNLPFLAQLTLWVLAAASTVTVVQRILMVRRQSLAAAGRSGAVPAVDEVPPESS